MTFLDHLPHASRQRLEQVAERVVVPTGSLLIRRGARDADFFRVERGAFEVVDSTQRPEMILNVMGPGAVFGEMSFLTGEPRSVDVRAGEESVVMRWSAEALRRELDRDAELAGAFFRATSVLLSRRLRTLNEAATTGALGPASARAAAPEDVRGPKSLAESVKAELLAAEAAIRRAGNPRAGAAAIEGALATLVDRGRRMFEALPSGERAGAGQIIANELNPYLVRARLAELSLGRSAGHSGDATLLAHVELGEPRGSDGLGKALDAALLTLPTAEAHRARQAPIAACVERSLVHEGAVRLLVLHAATGALVARLRVSLAVRGGEITCVDGNREGLAFLDSGAASATPRMKLRLVHEDLGRLALGHSDSRFGGPHLVVVNGLADYLPDRVLADLARRLGRLLPQRGTLVLDGMAPTPDGFLFDHVLGWPTVRRAAESAVELLRASGLDTAEVVASERGGWVVRATLRQPLTWTNTMG